MSSFVFNLRVYILYIYLEPVCIKKCILYNIMSQIKYSRFNNYLKYIKDNNMTNIITKNAVCTRQP